MTDSVKILDTAVPRRAPFFGRHAHNLDPKKRLTVPAKWRKLVDDDSLFLLPGMGRPCLMLLPSHSLTGLMERLASAASSDPEMAALSLALGESGDHLVFDSQGRIRVSDAHLAEAQLETSVLLVGALNRIELWNPEMYEEHRKTAPSSTTAAQVFKV